jgi:hypothetical protein
MKKNINAPKISHPFKNYANAPFLKEGEWAGYIQAKEGECGNKVSLTEAKQIYKIVWNLSEKARKEHREAKELQCSAGTLDKIRKGRFIVKDRKTGLIGGRVTPFKRESLGLQRDGRAEDSIRTRHTGITAMVRYDFLEEIKRREIAAGYPCDNKRAIDLLEYGRKLEFFAFHRDTLTWRWHLCPEPTEKEIIVRRNEMTEKQRFRWGIFANLPDLYHNWRDEAQSPVMLWVIERNPGMTVEEVAKHYHAAWQYDNKAKVPLIKDRKTGNVCGTNTYLGRVFRTMPELSAKAASEAQDLGTWLADNVVGDNPLGYLDIAITEGHAMDMGGGRYIGADTKAVNARNEEIKAAAMVLASSFKRLQAMGKEQARQEEANRLAEDKRRAMEQVATKWKEKLRNPGRQEAITIRGMPRMKNDNFQDITRIGGILGISDWDTMCVTYWSIKELGLFLVDSEAKTTEGADFARIEAQKQAEKERKAAKEAEEIRQQQEKREKRVLAMREVDRLRKNRQEVVAWLEWLPRTNDVLAAIENKYDVSHDAAIVLLKSAIENKWVEHHFEEEAQHGWYAGINQIGKTSLQTVE